MTDWQPIESAPHRFGERLLLGGCRNGPPVQIGSWNDGDYVRYGGIDIGKGSYTQRWVGDHVKDPRPTHWAPLPDLPEK